MWKELCIYYTPDSSLGVIRYGHERNEKLNSEVDGMSFIMVELREDLLLFLTETTKLRCAVSHQNAPLACPTKWRPRHRHRTCWTEHCLQKGLGWPSLTHAPLSLLSCFFLLQKVALTTLIIFVVVVVYSALLRRMSKRKSYDYESNIIIENNRIEYSFIVP